MRRIVNAKRGACRTGKVRYRDEKSATLRLRSIQANSHKHKVPQRAYECPHCHGFHLTSST